MMQRTQTGEVREANVEESSDFSIVSGGLLFRLWRRTGLAGQELELTLRRVIVTVLVTWLPLLVLTILEGNAWGRTGKVTFLRDLETHVRLLIAAPLFILAELRVHRVLSQLVRLFVVRGLVKGAARTQFDAAVASARRLRDSAVPELLLIALVYGVGLPFVWRDRVALDVSSWYATVEGGHLYASLAGWWAALVAIPVCQFLALRWFFRFFIWGRFLWQVSRTKLALEPTHPDGTAGLHFLCRSGRAYNVVLTAFGTVLAGMIANRILYEGAKLLQFKVEIVGVVGVLLLSVLGPMLAFYQQLRVARRRGMEEYGTLGQQYAREFNRKWIRGGNPPTDQPLLGSHDIQSLSDLRSGYAMIERIRLVPFGTKNVTSLVAIILAPVAPLLLTVFSVEQLVERVLKALF
jgi:hypothetical protein